MAYAYLLWDALLGAAWIIAYAALPRSRRRMLWSSLMALPFGIGELFFRPDYWDPATLFGLGARYGLDIESFLLMLFLGGLASVAYETLISNSRPFTQRCCGRVCTCHLSLILALLVFLFLLHMTSWNVIWMTIAACLAGGVFSFVAYPRLRRLILLGGAIFMLFYLISLAIMDLIVPGWIAATWNMSALSGMVLFSVPVEEVIFGFAFGTLWTPLYEEVCSHLQAR